MVTWNIHLNDIATVPVALHSFDVELSEYVYRGKEALIAGPAFGLTVNTEVFAFLAMLDPHAVTQRSIAVAQNPARNRLCRPRARTARSGGDPPGLPQ